MFLLHPESIVKQTAISFQWKRVGGRSRSTSTKRQLYLYSVAEVGSGGDGHHGQQARSRPDVQDDDLLTASLHSGHGRPDALVVLLILGTTAELVKRKGQSVYTGHF